MQSNPKPCKADGSEGAQRAILALLLAGHPIARTAPELAREIGSRDTVEEAICALADAGLLEFQGGISESLRPTSAARRCHRLDSW